MNDINKEFRKYLLNFDEFKALCKYFIHRATELKVGDSEICNKSFAKLAEVIYLGVADSINNISESPIEKMFLNSLLLCSIKSDALGIVLFQTHDNAEEEIKLFREEISNFKEFIKWSNNKGFSNEQRDDFLDSELAKGKISKEEKVHIANLITKYHYLNLENKFHMCLQPKLYGYFEDKAYIRPDLLFFIPTQPDIKIIVECDGFQYHSDKKSFTQDRIRDRVLQKQGFQVLRYSGSEIYKNPIGVSGNLLDHLWEFEK